MQDGQKRAHAKCKKATTKLNYVIYYTNITTYNKLKAHFVIHSFITLFLSKNVEIFIQ